ncbi:hypothetical protein ACNQUF_12590, partial [Corynebacterium diphtheriae]
AAAMPCGGGEFLESAHDESRLLNVNARARKCDVVDPLGPQVTDVTGDSSSASVERRGSYNVRLDVGGLCGRGDGDAPSKGCGHAMRRR